ncbi:hypothetical protein MESS2_880005 [Mesorhizobium metallidurans STM 2683]|uniref:Uncharacterized protein n=1 Tax=Mesorhizobium metallidurans STM 2683 TaxID=1297569 RepID=M5EYY6_9HYPH|nr:hypothetical protein MESS2_880005 [Mesorhizobium metallidurans STM 2683]
MRRFGAHKTPSKVALAIIHLIKVDCIISTSAVAVLTPDASSTPGRALELSCIYVWSGSPRLDTGVLKPEMA